MRMKEPTQQYSDLINSLQSRIHALEDENRLLKERLDEAGVSYADIVSGDAEGVVELYDPDQGARIKKFDVTDKIASDFFMMFCRGRKDLYDLRYTNPKTGKNGYYTQCFNRWDRGCHIQKKDGVRCKDCELRAYKPVTLPLIKAHMNGTDPNGNDVVAIYPMLENNLCQLLVFDFDNHAKGAEQEDYANIDDRWKEEINALRRICKNLDVDAVVERSRSGRGAHLWIFFKEMIPARLARKFGFALLEKGAESVNLKSFKYYDRMIPTQDALPEGGLGNVIALPLQGMALKSGNSAFVDENWNAYEDQLKVLAGTRRLTRQEIEDYLSLWYSTGFTSEDNGTDAPWDKNSEIEAGGVKGVVRIVLADRIYIDSSGMSNKTKRQLRRMATFSNKQYFQNQAMDMPNYDESRFIYLGSDEGKYIVLPRGLREDILKKFDNAGIRYKIEDKRTQGRELNISFKGELRESQIPAAETMLENETGILHAATAFGKTVVCCDMIARRGISTLILVDRADLMNQWIKRLDEFLDIDEELPEYQTKTGRTRKRKSLIGNLQGAHDTLTGIVDVAMIRSLKKKDGFHPMLKEYAQVYFDECHHAASESAIEVLQEINAKYVYGVTATPKRGDGKVTGTTEGITAIQMDIKIHGLTRPIVEGAIARCREARLFIMDTCMKPAIDKPRATVGKYAPKIVSLTIDPEKIGDVVGQRGKTINEIIARTEVKIDITDDGNVSVCGTDEAKMAQAVDMIKTIVTDFEEGQVFKGTVVSIKEFGAFVEFAPGKEGMVHISKICRERINRVEDVLTLGDKVTVVCLGKDKMGRTSFSMKDVAQN